MHISFRVGLQIDHKFVDTADGCVQIVVEGVVVHQFADGAFARVEFFGEHLQVVHRVVDACKEFGKLLYCGTNGNLLNYFDKFFSRGLYNVISGSFVWNSTKNGYDFWIKIEAEWELYRTHK